MQTGTDRRACLLLAAGAALGVLLGSISVLELGGAKVGGLPANAIALLNDRVIRDDEFVRTVTMLAQDKRTAMTDADRARVLDRLIEEELLLQHGLEMGLVDSDRSVRRAITAAMIASIVAERASEKPSEEELRDFYETNASRLIGRSQQLPEFADVRDLVEEAYLKRARSQSLRDYLDWLRKEAKITLLAEASP